MQKQALALGSRNRRIPLNIHHTIAAVSTPYGRGGIAVIRISGDEALEIAGKLFRPANGGELFGVQANHTVWGHIYYQEEQIDDGVAAVWRAPHSYTGEDTVEISCHGGIYLTQKVLEAAFLCGAVPAEGGEFTRRAFLNGKIGLAQAEAVMDLIDAETFEQIRLANSGVRGILSDKVRELYEEIEQAVSSIYAYMDYPDEDLTVFTAQELTAILQKEERELSALCESYQQGRTVREGIRTALIGKPNTGKSSLLNALSGKDRAIVTEIAGTTRDVIEETVNVGRLLLRIADTAGIRSSDDPIETIGVQRSLEELEKAELVLAVFDNRAFDDEDRALCARLKTYSGPIIAVFNKKDLGEADFPEIDVSFASSVRISAKTGEGIEELKQTLEALFFSGQISYDTQAMVANARQYAAVCAAHQHISDALKALEAGYSQDIAGLDMEQALTALGELDGREVSEGIVDSIFHRFCVGK